MLDVLVVGAGPAGRAVAAECAERGLHTSVVDPSPTRPWRATYGAWADELPADLPAGLVAARAVGVVHALTRRVLDHEYVVLDVPALRAHLDGRLAAAGVDVVQGRMSPERAAFLCLPIRNGVRPASAGDRPSSGAGAPRYAEQSPAERLPRARVVIDAGGAGQPLGPPRTGPPAEQTAFGLMVPAGTASPVLGPGEALFMDWRRAPGVGPDEWPTFLYALPLGDGLVLLEETSLARRPGLPVEVLADRLRARLAGHGVRPPDDAGREVVRFAVDTPRHRAPGVLGFGAAAPLTHPATGYQLATALREAPRVAAALVGGWSRDPLAAARAALWPAGARATHLLRRRALESLLRMPPARVPEFFEGFFGLTERRRADFLDGRRRPLRTVFAMAAVYGTTSWPVRRHLIGSFLAAPGRPGYTDRSSGE